MGGTASRACAADVVPAEGPMRELSQKRTLTFLMASLAAPSDCLRGRAALRPTAAVCGSADGLLASAMYRNSATALGRVGSS